MDWGRAKSVLIISFLMLNVLLGYQLWTEWQGRLNKAVDWTSLPPETQKVMQEKNIQITTPIPTQTPMMRELTFVFKHQAASEADKRIVLEPPPETRVVYFTQELEESLGQVIPQLGAYSFDQELSPYAVDDSGKSDGVFLFNRMENGWPIFRVQLALYYKEQRIREYTQDLIEVQPSQGAAEQQVLPASQAVANLIERNLPAGSTIKEIRLGYQGQVFVDEGPQFSAPAWRVLLENGDVYYVNAISAEVITEKGDVPVVPIADE